MDDNKDGIVRPIASEPPAQRALPKGEGFSRLTVILTILMYIAALTTLGTSLWFFLGFVENDTGFWHLLSAFCLSFGIGSLAYIPSFVIGRIAHHVLNKGPDRRLAGIAVLLTLPWLGLTYFIFRIGGFWMWVSLSILLLGLLILIWAIAVIRLSKRSSTT